MKRIYIIEDDASIRDSLTDLLVLQGFSVEAFLPDKDHGFECARDSALAADPDCILLDLTLPDTNGHVICRDLRSASNVPIIVVTSSEVEFDEVLSMNLGADDYITKPYSPAVLLARLQSVLRRHGNSESQGLTHRGVTLDLAKGAIVYSNEEAELTRNELRIMELLMRSPETVLSRHEIMCDLWDSDQFIDDNTLTVNINRLRKKLESIGVPDDFLCTRRGLGYMVS